MPDTDPKTMRRQQDRDTPQDIQPDETAARGEASDSDTESRRAREAAKRGEARQANEAMDEVFNENRRPENSGEVAESTFLEDAATDGNTSLVRDASLVRKGRSLLGG